MVATPSESRIQQARTGALTQLLIRQLAPQLADGMPAVEYIAACVAAQRLGHETAAADMAAFIGAYRREQVPGRDMPAPVQAEFPERLAAWRAWRTADAVEQVQQERIPQEQADAAVRMQAEGAYRDTLGAGRDTLLLSSQRAGTRWRRMTGPSPCAFCAMLAGRSDYTTRESAVTIVGRRGRIKKGGRPAGSRFHGHCTCTAVEVLGAGDSVQQGWRDAYEQAVQECRDDGVEPTTANVLARMRAQGGFSRPSSRPTLPWPKQSATTTAKSWTATWHPRHTRTPLGCGCGTSTPTRSQASGLATTRRTTVPPPARSMWTWAEQPAATTCRPPGKSSFMRPATLSITSWAATPTSPPPSPSSEKRSTATPRPSTGPADRSSWKRTMLA